MFTEKFSRSNTHLLVSEPAPCNSVKISKAEDWGIPIVSKNWLYKCLETVGRCSFQGSIIEFKQYAIHLKTRHQPVPAPIRTLKLQKVITESVVSHKVGIIW